MISESLIVLILAAINFTHILDFVIMMPLGPQLMTAFGISAQEFSVIVASYTFSAGASGLLGAFFIDRFDRKLSLSICYAGFIAGTIACAIAPSFEFLVLARVLAGIFGGLVGSLVFSIVGDIVPQQRRGAAMGKISAAFSVASVLGIPIGLYLAQLFNWHAAFIFIALMAAIFWVLAYKKLPPIRGHLDGPVLARMAAFEEVLRYPNHWRAFIFIFCLTLAGFSVIPFIMPYLVSNVGFEQKYIPLSYFCGGVATFFSAPLIGRLSDKYGKHRVFQIAALLSILPIWMITHLKTANLYAVLSLMVMFMVFVSGRFVPALALTSGATRPHMRGAFMSLHSSVLQLGSGIASLTGGWLLTTEANGMLSGYNHVGYMAVGFTLLTIWLSRLVKLKDI